MAGWDQYDAAFHPMHGDRTAVHATGPDDRRVRARDRELIEPNEGDKRYVRRNEAGEFTEDQSDAKPPPDVTAELPR